MQRHFLCEQEGTTTTYIKGEVSKGLGLGLGPTWQRHWSCQIQLLYHSELSANLYLNWKGLTRLTCGTKVTRETAWTEVNVWERRENLCSGRIVEHRSCIQQTAKWNYRDQEFGIFIRCSNVFYEFTFFRSNRSSISILGQYDILPWLNPLRSTVLSLPLFLNLGDDSSVCSLDNLLTGWLQVCSVQCSRMLQSGYVNTQLHSHNQASLYICVCLWESDSSQQDDGMSQHLGIHGKTQHYQF